MKTFKNKKVSSIKQYIVLCIAIGMIFVLAGCANNHIEETKTGKDDDRIQIGLCFDSFLIERWERDRDIFVSTAKELGADVNVQNANGVLEEQIKQIEYLIDKKMDVIVIVGIDAEGLEKVVTKAKSEGIIVIAYDRMIQNANADLYISFDNEMVGEMMGNAMVAAGIPGNQVLMLSGPTADPNVVLVNDGFQKVMNENQVQIIDIMYADGWTPELCSDYLYNNPEVVSNVKGIMCGNDNLATQAVRVLAEKRLAGKILVTGQDGELEACQRIVEGTQLMTVYKPVEKEAKVAAECAIDLALGREISMVNESTFDGTYDIPSIVLEPISVTKDNMDQTIINSGFHLKEEVYLNVLER